MTEAHQLIIVIPGGMRADELTASSLLVILSMPQPVQRMTPGATLDGPADITGLDGYCLVTPNTVQSNGVKSILHLRVSPRQQARDSNCTHRLRWRLPIENSTREHVTYGSLICWKATPKIESTASALPTCRDDKGVHTTGIRSAQTGGTPRHVTDPYGTSTAAARTCEPTACAMCDERSAKKQKRKTLTSPGPLARPQPKRVGNRTVEQAILRVTQPDSSSSHCNLWARPLDTSTKLNAI
ncbi:hypothetical protein BJV78DRAFT_1151653 [Lactifluus subvellereus]|nr:hypothetical protein BJV78DRAFT_1151653 [Lactifluus subvellereus]